VLHAACVVSTLAAALIRRTPPIRPHRPHTRAQVHHLRRAGVARGHRGVPGGAGDVRRLVPPLLRAHPGLAQPVGLLALLRPGHPPPLGSRLPHRVPVRLNHLHGLLRGGAPAAGARGRPERRIPSPRPSPQCRRCAAGPGALCVCVSAPPAACRVCTRAASLICAQRHAHEEAAPRVGALVF
jgi:hypothetical protein